MVSTLLFVNHYTSFTFFIAAREGNSSLILEVADQLEGKPGAVIVSVGGGGLMCGVAQGMHDVGWKDVPLVAMETRGADSLASSLQAGELITLPCISRWALFHT